MKNLIGIIIAALFLLSVSSVFVINEGERGIVFKFSKIKRDSTTGEMLVFWISVFNLVWTNHNYFKFLLSIKLLHFE
jgi:regulator of protease activity HflC (stomatin/prohibitin superfamily)